MIVGSDEAWRGIMVGYYEKFFDPGDVLLAMFWKLKYGSIR